MINPRDSLVKSGAIVEGRFVYNSGKHGRLYVNKTAALVFASHSSDFARRIAAFFWRQDIEVVVGPELGAVSLMADVRHELYMMTGRDILGIVAEKVRDVSGKATGEFKIARDQARFIKGKKVLVVEDILTTGKSAKATVEAVRIAGGIPHAVGALWNRGRVTATDLGVDTLFPVIDEPIQDYPEDDCPLCASDLPVNTDLGKGNDFLGRKAALA